MSIRLEPLGALGLLEFDLALASPIVDLLLGGVGATAAIRDLTDIEEEILTSLVQLIVRELNVAWAAIGLRFEYEKRENAGTAARMMSMAEKTLCMIFEVTMPEVKGVLNFCLPAVVLNSILRQLTSERDRPRRQSHENHTRLRDLAGATSVGMVLAVHADEAAGARAGDADAGEDPAAAAVAVRDRRGMCRRAADCTGRPGEKCGASWSADHQPGRGTERTASGFHRRRQI